MAAFICLIPTQTQARDIIGLVLSDADSTAVGRATCRIKDGDKFLSETTTKSDGQFSLATDLKTSLTLEVTKTGYMPTEVVVPEGGKNFNVGTVFLSQGHVLDEIVVVGSHAIDARGRTIVYPSSDEVKSSPSAVSLFQKMPLPGLDANPITRSLTVDGGTPMILINGIPSSVSDFNSLSPKDIAKVEFSRQTPARYADRGTCGLISITLKKRNDGGNVFLWGRSAFNCGFVDASLRLSYHQGPSEFLVAYSPSWRNYHKVYDTQRASYIADDFHVDLTSSDRNPFNYFYNPVALKYNYAPTTRTLLSATLGLSATDNRRRMYGRTEDSYLGKYDWNNRSKTNDIAPVLDLFLHHEFDGKNTLEAQVVGTFTNSDYRRANAYFLPEGTENYDSDIDSRRRSLITEINYSHGFGKNTEMSVGYQNTISHSTNTYLTTDHKPTLSENNNYLYAEIGTQVGKMYVAASTGAKIFLTKNGLNKRHFIRNISTVKASYNINSKWSLQGAFQYSPSIPSLAMLTDYPQQTSPYLVSNGSPKLKVAETFTYQLAPTFRYRKLNLSLLLSYSHTHNAHINDIYYLGNKLFMMQTTNARSMREFSPNLNVQIAGVGGFGANVRLGLRHYHYGGGTWSHDLTSFEASGSIWWTRSAWTISYYGRLPAKYLSGHYIGKGENGNNLSLSWRPDKHWTIEASCYNFLDRKGFRYPQESISSVNPSKTERWIKDNGNMLAVSISYSADFGSIFRTARRGLNNSDRGTALPGY